MRAYVCMCVGLYANKRNDNNERSQRKHMAEFIRLNGGADAGVENAWVENTGAITRRNPSEEIP